MASAPVIPQFFVPQQEPGSVAEERQYELMRDAVGADSSRVPRNRRIFSVGCRLAGKDCVVEVGRPDPVEGSEVLAIFNVRGEDEPFSGLHRGRLATSGAAPRTSRLRRDRVLVTASS